MATIKEITHDSSTTIGDFYDTVVDPDGGISVIAGAALGGSVYGVDFDHDAGAGTMDLDEAFASTVPASGECRFRCRVNFDGLTNDNSSDYVGFVAVSADGGGNARLTFEFSGDGSDGYTVTAYVVDDIGSKVITVTKAMPTGDT